MKEASGWVVEIRNREEERAAPPKNGEQGELLVPKFQQKGVKNRMVPLVAEDAAILTARKGWLISPGTARKVRENLVNRAHNLWLKGMIGRRGEKVQGNHRLRDTVCSAPWSLYGPAAAQEAAGHVDPKTTSKHYAKRMATVPAAMLKELNPWAPGKVVPLRRRTAGGLSAGLTGPSAE